MWNVSASQYALFSRCNRKWFFRYPLGMTTPQDGAQRRGVIIHKAIEDYYNHGVMPGFNAELGLDLDPYIKALIQYEWQGEFLMPPAAPQGQRMYLVEHRFSLPTAEGLPAWDGIVDFMEDRPIGSFMPDFKTISTLARKATPEKLRKDPQPLSYARLLFAAGETRKIETGHIYIEVRSPPPKKVLPRVAYVPIELEKSYVDDWWEGEAIPTVRQMLDTDSIIVGVKDPVQRTLCANQIPFNLEACGDYGSCPYLLQCDAGKNTVSLNVKKSNKKGHDMTNPLLARMHAAQNGATAPSQAAPMPPAAAPMPPAPSQAAPMPPAPSQAAPMPPAPSQAAPMPPAPATAAPMPSAPATAAPMPSAPAFMQAAPAATPGAVPGAPPPPELRAPDASTATPPIPEPTAAKTRASKGASLPKGAKGGFELYIDCRPVVGGKQPTPFEAWFASIDDAIRPGLAEQGKYSVYDLSFAEQKSTIHAGVRMKLESGDVPAALYVQTSNGIAKDALAILIPAASKVVQA